jgi:hypothetical protein
LVKSMTGRFLHNGNKLFVSLTGFFML